MNMIYKGAKYIKDIYAQLNPATLTGAIDVLVIEHPDGTLTASPFHVRFGKLGVLRAKEKIVNISINGQVVHLHMKLGDQGEAFFVEETLEQESIPARLLTSPLPSRPSSPCVAEEDAKQLFDHNGETSKRRRRKRRKRKTSEAQVTITSDTERDETVQQLSFNNNENEQNSDEVQKANDEEDFDLSRMCSVFSDSEIPHNPNGRTDVHSSPYSDSETVEHYANDINVQWEWGQLPDPNETDSNSGNKDFKFEPSNQLAEETNAVSHEVSMLEDIQDCNNNKTSSVASTPSKPIERKSSKDKSDSTVARGLYLDDVLDLPQDEAGKYLQTHKDTATPLHQNDMDMVVPRSPDQFGSDAGVDSGTDCLSDCGQFSFELSLCGGKLVDGKLIVEPDKFQEKTVSYDRFVENPLGLLKSTDLVVHICDRYLTWQEAQPLLVASAVFKQNLTQQSISQLLQQNEQTERERNYSTGRLSWLFGRGSRRQSHRESTSSITSDYATNASKVNKDAELTEIVVEPQTSHAKVTKSYSAATMPTDLNKESTSSSCSDEEIKEINNKQMLRSQTVNELYPSLSLKVMKKTTRLSSEQLKSLNLKPGGNEITFSVTSQYQGTSKCVANVYLWRSTDKIVVSDVDGTITKSDVFGQILPVVGKDWTQGGVAQLYRNIEKNGYRFIYVSSRAIGQAGMTKGYLNWINQQGVSLPPGPLFLSPTSLVMAFHREVIEKKPEKFKIECLNDVCDLFPANYNPFVAGFGNKHNDVTAYTEVGISANRIFTINHKGELKQEELQTYKTSYNALGDIVDNFFPCLKSHHSCEYSETQDYNSFSFWKSDIPTLSDEMFNL